MFTVKILKNGTPYKTIALSSNIKIIDLIIQDITDHFQRLAFKINNKFVSDQYEISKDCYLDCIGYDTLCGHRIYQDTALFILMKAFYNLTQKDEKLVVEHSIGNGIYIEYFGKNSLTPEFCVKLEDQMKLIVSKNLEIIRKIISYNKAKKIFLEMNRNDVIRNLDHLHKDTDHIYQCENYYDYFVRHLTDNTGIISHFKITYKNPGLILQLPPIFQKKLVNKKIPHKLFTTNQEYDKMLNILRTHNVADINDKCLNYSISEMIQIEEALQEKKIVYFADYIKAKKNIKLVLISGPSSSGKTTFAKRLSIQLSINNLKPSIIGLDDYFLPRYLTPKTKSGDYDFETIDAIDIDLVNEHITQLLQGKEIELPKFNFITGKREKSNKYVKLGDNDIIIMEGIHAINEKLTSKIPKNNKTKIYISCLNQLNVDIHNRIPSSDCRKIRRICRDFKYRGYSAEETLTRWESIRKGEEKHIFPFQESADLFFNSSLTYEIGILKKYAKKILNKITIYSPTYEEATRLLFLLDHFIDISDDLVPINSIIREFSKDSIFKY